MQTSADVTRPVINVSWQDAQSYVVWLSRKRGGARTIDALWRAMGDIRGLYSPDECRNYLGASGYAPD